MDIDVVVAWVDDSDPQWRAERSRYCGRKEDCDEVRFRDWGLLKYWFRSIETFMPWVRKIHFVTYGHLPQWLDTTAPKLHIVRHEDYIPAKYLPTFSARPIELNLHRIEGLSEHFIYFNDDMYPLKPLRPEDFFVDGLPCASPILSPLIALKRKWPFGHTLLNDISFVNAHFKLKKVLKAAPEKWFSLKYGKSVIKNYFHSFQRDYFLGFEVFHEPSSMLKSTFEAVWAMEPELLDKTCTNKFRTLEDVNQYVILYYNYCTNRFYPRSPKHMGYFDIGQDDHRLYDAIERQRYKYIVANDSAEVSDFQKTQEELIGVFQKILPEPSSFERG